MHGATEQLLFNMRGFMYDNDAPKSIALSGIGQLENYYSFNRATHNSPRAGTRASMK